MFKKIDAGVKNDRNNGTGSATNFTDLTNNGSFIEIGGNFYEPYDSGWIGYVKSHGVWESITTTNCYLRNTTSSGWPIRSRLNFITRPIATANFSSVIADVKYLVHQTSVRIRFSVGMQMLFLNDGEDKAAMQSSSTDSGSLTDAGMGDREGTYRATLAMDSSYKTQYKWCIPMIYIRMTNTSGTDYGWVTAGSGITGLWAVT